MLELFPQIVFLDFDISEICVIKKLLTSQIDFPMPSREEREGVRRPKREI